MAFKIMAHSHICVGLLTFLHLAVARVIYNNNNVFLQDQAAMSFLSRSLLYNNLDLELVVPDNLERECMEEICCYEEAREVFEDDTLTAKFWKDYTNSQESAPAVDVSGLVAGIVAILVSGLIATVVGCYYYKGRAKTRRTQGRAAVTSANAASPPESVPLSGTAAPGLPSYNEALSRSGQHDAPPAPLLRWGPLRDSRKSSS
ncbi:transmembrane gamma-carboxyglutamic acid protein 2 [Megalops cyprinoides]|uniref:transmembrane gamma-carboxyglutamic acid protein 2 n=1 Tax=Megalops cyprinoides TaxID=118141 RepID=UPI00186455CA|nr:transmembrane gamma-carboxyglutamic acid protein 2 [Megalops cyprinoides]